MSSCPMFETLALFANGQLDIEMREDVDKHLSQLCSDCHEKIAWYKKAFAALNAPLKKGPDRLKAKAHAIFKNSIYARPYLPGFIFTTMTYDSMQMSGMLQTRSLLTESNESIRRMIFRADFSSQSSALESEYFQSQTGFDIDIEIQQLSYRGNFTVRGQILFEQDIEEMTHPFYLDLFFMGKEHVQAATANQYGEFVFSQIVEGYYTLQIKFDKLTAVATIPVTI